MLHGVLVLTRTTGRKPDGRRTPVDRGAVKQVKLRIAKPGKRGVRTPAAARACWAGMDQNLALRLEKNANALRRERNSRLPQPTQRLLDGVQVHAKTPGNGRQRLTTVA